MFSRRSRACLPYPSIPWLRYWAARILGEVVLSAHKLRAVPASARPSDGRRSLLSIAPPIDDYACALVHTARYVAPVPSGIISGVQRWRLPTFVVPGPAVPVTAVCRSRLPTARRESRRSCALRRYWFPPLVARHVRKSRTQERPSHPPPLASTERWMMLAMSCWAKQAAASATTRMNCFIMFSFYPALFSGAQVQRAEF